jgi:hypothetical protein
MCKGDRNSLIQLQKWQMLVDNDPKQIGTRQFQKIVLDFFKEHSIAYLDITLVESKHPTWTNTKK